MSQLVRSTSLDPQQENFSTSRISGWNQGIQMSVDPSPVRSDQRSAGISTVDRLPFATYSSSSSGFVRLKALFALCGLLFALCALSFATRSSAANDSSLLNRRASLGWINDRAWMRASNLFALGSLSGTPNAYQFSNTISGTVLGATGAPLSGKTIKLIQNGTVSGTTALSDGSGIYTFTGLTLLDGTQIIVYIAGDASTRGATFTVTGTLDIITLDIFQNDLVVRSDNGTVVTNTLLKSAQGASPDADLLGVHNVNPSNILTTQPGHGLRIWSATTYAPGADINDGGDWINNGTLQPGTSTVTFNGTTNQTIKGLNSTTFNDLTISNSGADPNNVVALDGSLGATNTQAATLTVDSGVFDQGIDVASSELFMNGIGECAHVRPAATWRNRGRRDVVLACNVLNEGTIEFNSKGRPCGDTDEIHIRSSLTGTQRTWTGPGTFSMTDVDVRDQTVPTPPTLPLQILVNSGTDHPGTNTGWTFVETCSGPYTWIGGVGESWANPVNWSPNRTDANNSSTSDVLIFDGSVTTAPVVEDVQSQTNAAIRLKPPVVGGGPDVTLHANLGGATLTLDGATGNDLDVPADTSLTLASSRPLTIELTAPTFNGSVPAGHVAGQIMMKDDKHQLIGDNAGEIIFNGLNALTIDSTYSATTHPFGQGTSGSVIFQSPAVAVFSSGLDPFGGVNKSVVTFNQGSTARFTSTTAYFGDGGTYGYLILDGLGQNYFQAGANQTTILNNFTLVFGNTLVLSSTAGADVNLFGNFRDETALANGFQANGRTVKFQGTTQTIFNAGLQGTFSDVSIAQIPGGKVQLLSPTRITGQLSLNNADSLLELNSHTLELDGAITGPGNLKGDSIASMVVGNGNAGALGTVNFVSGGRTLSGLQLNHTPNGSMTLGTDLALTGNLLLTDGILNTGANTLSLSSSSSASRSNGYVIGNLQKSFGASGLSSFTFPLGTANAYSPLDANVTANSGGTLTAKAVEGEQPNVSGANALQRYWVLNGSGITANLTFHYRGGTPTAGDVVGNEGNYKIFKYNGAFTQFTPNATGNNGPSDHFATVNGISSFSDWTLGETSALNLPTLGTYSDTSVALSGNATVTPSAAPTNTTSINVSTSTNFKGTFASNPATGVVRITDAHPAGTYLVTVTALGPSGSTTATFNLTVQQGTACGGVSTFTNGADVNVGNNAQSVAIGDFNNDGKQDLAVANFGLDSVAIRIGDGLGGFSGTTTISVGSDAHPISVAVGDFNSDGKQDLAVANADAHNVSILLGDGLGGFSPTTPVPFADSLHAVAIGDFNNDGKQDLAVVRPSVDKVSIRLGDGLGGFSGTTDVSVGGTPRNVAIGDFNNDGKQDLAVTNLNGFSVPLNAYTVSILLGDGSGGFSRTDVGDTNQPDSIKIGDFNNDGKQDLAVSNTFAASVTILLGDGSGGFSATPDISVGNSPISIAVGDFDNDGKQDFATANDGSDNVSIRFGNGSGGSSSGTEINVGPNPFAVAIGDFNNDGKQDLAAANNQSNNLSIRLGACFSLLQFSATNYTTAEDNSGTHTVTVTVTRTGTGSTGAASVHYATSDDSATLADNDYDAASGDLSWSDGDMTSRTFDVTIHGDTKFETNETVNLTISAVSGAALGTPNTATITITNEDLQPTISINDVTQAEGNSGTTDFDFTVSLSNASYQTVTVNAQTADGTAKTADSDYTAVGSTLLTFAPNVTTQHFHVLVNGDTKHEADETFFVNLSGETNATIADGQGLGTINNDDTCASFSTVYVDASWASTAIGDDPDGVAGAPAVFGCDSFATIQQGINAVTAGGIVIVHAGTYPENPNANKAVTIQGPNAGTAGSAGRVAEAFVITNGTQDAVFTVSSNNVTIDGFIIDGDDPNVTGTPLQSGDDTDVQFGVRVAPNTPVYNHATVQNNIIKRAPIGFLGSGASQNNLITANWFDSIGMLDSGYCVSLRNNFYADVTNNKMTRAWTGLHTFNFSAAGPATWTFSGNDVHSYAAGVWHSQHFLSPTGLTIDNNQFSAQAGAVANNFGLLLTDIKDTVNSTITHNTITGHNYGVGLFDVPTSNTITIGSTNSIVNSSLAGVLLTDNLTFNPIIAIPNFTLPGAASTVNLNGLPVSGNTTNGLKIESQTNTQTLNLSGGTSVSGGPVGLLMTGAGARIAGNNLTDTSFTGQATYIKLANGASASLEINGTGVSFDGKTGATATLAQNYAIEDKIVHAIDDGTLGFVRVKAGNVFVTPNSFNLPATSTPSVQRAIDVGGNVDMVNVQAGTYSGGINGTAAGKAITLSPGASPAQVTVNGDLTLDSSDTIVIEIDGTDPTSQYDNFIVTGVVTLGNAALPPPTGSHMPAPGQIFTIIRNDGTDPVNGTFAGLPEGALIANFLGSSFGARISYVGGSSGRNVTLTVVATDVTVAVSPAAVTEDSGTPLVYTFTRSSSAGSLTVTFNAAGSADPNNDYTVSGAPFTPVTGTGTVTFGDGESTRDVIVTPVADSNYEANETVVVAVTAGGYNIGTPGSASGAITNDDAPPATLIVNTTADTDDGLCSPDPGGCTLREAINAANFSSDFSAIGFDIPASGVQTISPTTPLPIITQPVFIDGYTQKPCATNPAPCSSFNTRTDNTDDAVILIELTGAGAGAGADGLVLAGGGSTIDGLVINRFGGAGVKLTGAGGNDVTGNFIGTDATGMLSVDGSSVPYANQIGVLVDNVGNNMIGCSTPDERNVISANTGDGVNIVGTTSGADQNLVWGNLIGLNAAGAALGNGGAGVSITDASDNSVGFDLSGAGQGNIIAFNTGSGVQVKTGPGGPPPVAIGNIISQNSIHDNGGIGIDLGGNGVTPNGSGPDGPNNYQNFPESLSATAAGGSGTIAGTLNSADGNYKVEFFANPSGASGCDSSGNGEGLTYLGTKPVTVSGGTVTFTSDSYSLNVGDHVTATATDSVGNTSEFSQCVEITAATTFTITASAGTGGSINPSGAVLVNTGADQSFTITPDPGYAIADVAVDSVTQGPLTNYSFTNVTANHTIAASFTTIPCLVLPVTVNTTDDNHDLTRDGICADLNGNCTLRAAIEEANAAAPACGTIDINFSVTGQIFVGNSVVAAYDTIAHDVNIIGPGADQLAINGDGEQRIFTIGTGKTVTISGLTLINGYASADNGGALSSDGGTVTINNCFITQNSADVGGGAIYSTNGSLTINNTTIDDNDSIGGFGGGIDLPNGTLTLTNSTVSNNSADDGGGGGINTDGGTTKITGSTINDNFTTRAGGGIRKRGTLTIVNSTVSGNVANNNGGGIHNDRNSATIVNTTITNNAAGFDCFNESGTCSGGGIYNNGASILLRNTIVAGNFNGDLPSSITDDVSGTVSSSSNNNLVGDETNMSGISNGDGNHNQVGTSGSPIDPKLGPLANNGGPTPTHTLLSGSPAIDAADNCVLDDSCSSPLGFNLTTDQRGMSRPQGPKVDIGAFEVLQAVVNTTADHDDGICEALVIGNPSKDCTLREAIRVANLNLGALILFDIPADGGTGPGCVNGVCTISPATTLPAITSNVSIDGYTQQPCPPSPTGPCSHPNTLSLNAGDDAVLLIVLDGVNVTTNGRGLDLEEGSDQSTIRGLVIDHWNTAGIYINDSSANTIEGNFIGIDQTGTTAAGTSGGAGVLITSDCSNFADDNLIGGEVPAARNIISGNGASGIEIGGPDGSCAGYASVEGNYIGTDFTGKVAVPNAIHGVMVENGSEFNVIGCKVLDGDNLISGNADAGVYITDTDSCAVQGNFIGTDLTGAASLENKGNKRGVVVSNSGLVFIGISPEDGVIYPNFISGNTDNGIELVNGAGLNFVLGNFIGTDLNGTTPVGNGKSGVLISGADGNTIGDGVQGDGNLISGNKDEGVALLGASFNVVQGNFIGTDINGNVVSGLGNGAHGVEVYHGVEVDIGSTDNEIGGVTECGCVTDSTQKASTRQSAASISVGTNRAGLAAADRAQALASRVRAMTAKAQAGASKARWNMAKAQAPASEAQARRGKAQASAANRQGNARAGRAAGWGARRRHRAIPKAGKPQSSKQQTTSARLETARPQVSVLSVQNTSAGNIIAGNGGDGVRVSSAGDINNLISLNSIFANVGLGIDLGGNGVTANDSSVAGPNDTDEGPNHLQNFPLITGYDGNTSTISGTLDSGGPLAQEPNGIESFTIEIFRNTSCDGEGQFFVGSGTASLVSAGHYTFSITISGPIQPGQNYTATATDGNNNTSEFSPCFCIGKPATPTATNDGPACENGSVQLHTPDAGPGATYFWTGPNSFTATVREPVVTNLLSSSAGDYSVVVTLDGCPSDPGITTVVVKPAPAAPTASNTGPYLAGQTIQLNATPVGGATYSWTGPNAFTSSDPNPAIPNATTAKAGDYTVFVTNTDGCTSATSTTTVVVNCPTTFDVNSAGDAGDADPNDGICRDSVNNLCTLRAAIEQANALPTCGPITIDFINGVNAITVGSQLTINHTVIIDGSTAPSLVISGNNATRLFTVNNGRTASILNLTLMGGNGSGGDGGAIQNNGTLTLNGVTLTGNSAVNGGAIRNDGNLVLTNTTISGNTANTDGGGLFSAIGQATLTNVTIAYNRADNDNVGGGNGGGLNVASGNVLLHNTIVADDYQGSSPSTTANNINGTVDPASTYNLVGTGGGGLTNGVNNNQVGVATAFLGKLIDNGGRTFTIGLLYNSPAIDAGDDCVFNNSCAPTLGSALTSDQRGLSRKADGDLTSGAHVDIGAYERQTTEERFAPVGTNVNIDHNDVRLTFPSVTNVQPQTVELTVNAVPVDAPAGSGPALDIHPTSNFYGTPVTMCFYLPAITNPTNFATIKVYHREGGVLVEHAETRDFANKTVCINDITSFSQFVINQPVTPTAANADITGQILDSNGTPVEGAAVRMSGTQNRLTVTDAEGNYHFADVETNGFYVVSPSRPNFNFNPAQRSFSQIGAHTDAVFTGTPLGTAVNPLDASEYFVRQQYLDFLGREPDESGFNFWVNNIESCASDLRCREAKRIDTSAAFFLSIEFQQTGYLVYRAYEAAYGDLDTAPVPLTLREFTPDTQKISAGVVVLQNSWQQKLDINKKAFMNEFVQRPRFTAAYPTTMTPAEFVDKLFATAQINSTDSDYAASITLFAGAADSANVATRAQVLRRLAENASLSRREFNRAFVLMEYFGYLRRDPNAGRDTDFSGYSFWLDKLNTFNGNFEGAEMVKAFTSSDEYRRRFPR